MFPAREIVPRSEGNSGMSLPLDPGLVFKNQEPILVKSQN